MKKSNMYLIVIMVLIAIVTCLTGWQKADAADKLKIALVLPGKKDDVSFNQAMYRGMMEYTEKHADEVDVKVVENI
ncbi:MAG TPA: hypothetical protein PKJ88_06870, partial [Flexilinea sp.]|nr:hypothetical protein [Flexilinea sp.]